MQPPLIYAEFLHGVANLEVKDLTRVLDNASIILPSANQDPFPSFGPARYVLDYTSQSYRQANQWMSHITGYSNSYLLDGGIEFGLELWNKDDLHIYSGLVLKDNLALLKSLSPSARANCVFTCNYRVRCKDSQVKHLLQQSVFLDTTSEGLPLMAVGFITDITHLAPPQKIIHMVESISSNPPYRKLLLRKVHFMRNSDGLLTNREVEVLKWLCEGFSSLEIAEKLNRSVNTVNNHRRHMLEKTNSRNTMELLKYAINQGIL